MQPQKTRIEAVDIARGTALLAMAIYHFTWDLDFFGYIDPGTSVTGGWKVFARAIASSFLFLVGVSLYLAHGNGVRLQPFLRRLAVIAGAAAAITAITYWMFPDAFIFFGILHHIAVASVLGLAALRLPILALCVLAGCVVAAPHFVFAPFLDQPVFWWTGLSRNMPGSNDYIPIFPWLSAVLLGIAATKSADRSGLLVRIGALRPARGPRLVGALGRRSLLFYLVHQPVLFSSVWLFAQVLPPDRSAFFMQACTTQCMSGNEEPFCRAFCSCVLEEARAEGRAEALYEPKRDEETEAWLRNLAFR